MSLCPWANDYRLYDPLNYPLGFWRELDDLARNLVRYPFSELGFSQDTGASIKYDKDTFQANIDVQQFRPEELSVNISGNTVTIEGKHEEKRDEHGYISRHFVRKYVLPENCDVNQVQSKLSSDGVLTITAPRAGEEGKSEQREIPIKQTGQPIKEGIKRWVEYLKNLKNKL